MLSLREDSKLYLNFEKYGITNIREVNYDNHPKRGILNLIRCGYDEINGLEWKDKLEQMIENFDYLLSEIEKDEYLFPEYEFEHLLFFLHSKFKEKKDIVRIFDKVKRYIGNTPERYSITEKYGALRRKII